MRIIAIDPGFDRCGVAIVEKLLHEKEKVLYSSCIVTSRSDSLSIRLHHIGKEIDVLIGLWKPAELICEKIYFTKNQKTAVSVAEVKGMLRYIAASHGLEMREFTPLEIKVAITGYGKSEKKEIAHMVKKLVSVDKKEMLDDEYDAIAIGLTYFAHNPLAKNY